LFEHTLDDILHDASTMNPATKTPSPCSKPPDAVEATLSSYRQKYGLSAAAVEDLRPMLETIFKEFEGEVREELLKKAELAAERRAESNQIRREASETLRMVRAFVQAVESGRAGAVSMPGKIGPN